MRIGLDLQVLQRKPYTGIGKYALHLSDAIRKLKTNHEFVFFDNLPPKRIPFFDAHVKYARIFQKANLDVLHGLANTLPLLYKGDKGNRGGIVLTIHDLAIYKHPEWFPRRQWLSTKVVVPRSIKKADHIIVPSETTKRDLMELFGVSDEKITVIPHGVEERFYRSQETVDSRQLTTDYDLLPTKYILFVGTLEPRKNLSRLIEAYAGLPEDIKGNYDLVIAGARGWGYKELVLGIRDKVKILDYVPDDQLPTLYQNAVLFVYPSLYEGFGLPVLEAMAAGTPVVTSKGTAMEEICRLQKSSRACELVNPYSVEEIRDAMVKYLSPRDNAYASQISRAGVARAREFTWEKTARETLKIYEKLMEIGKNL